MKFSLMTAILVLAPTLALASPDAEAFSPTESLMKQGAMSSAEIAFEKKQLRLHVIEQAPTRAGNLSGDALRELCNGPTKMLRHACIKGEGASSARGVTMGENTRVTHDEPNRRETSNRRQTLNADSGAIKPVKPADVKPVKPADVKPEKPFPTKPGFMMGEKPTKPAGIKSSVTVQR